MREDDVFLPFPLLVLPEGPHLVKHACVSRRKYRRHTVNHIMIDCTLHTFVVPPLPVRPCRPADPYQFLADSILAARPT
jgi:hypothetical protein